jgi:toxin ParE1/3/4
MGAPVSGTPPELGVRRRLVQRFGIELDYVLGEDEIIVIAIFHCRRRPGYWHRRLAKIRDR